ncbi:LOB domain-containing protein 22-like [Vicia villosa]|uniref:LOB domain-containing protein 22-like n=1 Tax=Vicia villosa TaxID=3911 RepID=UPI00273BFAC1|nr:LOB domain-containing protein 22-like [Vicia villosa]
MNTIKSNKACAACTHQRRKCSKDCLLAPYFPANKPKMFHNAHSLYGVSNMVRILNEVPKEKRDLAMRTVIYESNVRKIYPIGGCVDVIKEYSDKISEALEELNQVKKVLDYCKVNHLPSQKLSSSLPSTSFQNPNLQPHFPIDHSLRDSISSHNPNLQPYFSMDHSPRASTNSDISNIPIFNNVGNVTNYYHNSENNIETMTNASPSDIIHREVNNAPTNTNLNINSMDAIRVAQLNSDIDRFDFSDGQFFVEYDSSQRN